MAKFRRRRRYYKKKKWSSNIQEILSTDLQIIDPGAFFQTYTLASNPIQSQNTVSQTYTVKNFAVDFYIDANGISLSEIEDLCAYIMYVPQGMNVTTSYNIEHPEYILNYKYLAQPGSDAYIEYQPFRIRSRLSRTLQTGDSVILYLKGTKQGSENLLIQLHGLIRWWTKAN